MAETIKGLGGGIFVVKGVVGSDSTCGVLVVFVVDDGDLGVG